MSDNGNGAGKLDDLEPGPRTLTLAGRQITVEPPSGRKAAQAFAILRGVSKELPGLVKAWGEFETSYEREHYAEVPRAEAMLRYGGPQPLHRDGEPVYNDAGELVTIPSGLDQMSDEAWESVDNMLRRPRSPDTWMTATAVLAEASEEVEENVYRLLALFTISNADVKHHRRAGTLKDHIADVVDDLLDDAGADELLELASVAGDVVDSAFRAKAREIGASRLGKALRLLGVDAEELKPQTPPEPTQTGQEETSGKAEEEDSTPTPSSSRPTSFSDSPEPSPDGPPTPSSTPISSSSEPSAIGSTSRPPE